MACCPFHNDKTPSMKLDRRYHCFGCGADGDVIDFTAALYGLGKKEAAVQLAQDFGISYEDWKPPGKVKKPKPRQKSPRNSFRKQRTAASVSLPIISTCLGHGERIMSRTPRRKPFIPGLWKPYRSKPKWNICWMCCCSGDRGKSGVDYGLRKGCDTA